MFDVLGQVVAELLVLSILSWWPLRRVGSIDRNMRGLRRDLRNDRQSNRRRWRRVDQRIDKVDARVDLHDAHAEINTRDGLPPSP